MRCWRAILYGVTSKLIADFVHEASEKSTDNDTVKAAVKEAKETKATKKGNLTIKYPKEREQSIRIYLRYYNAVYLFVKEDEAGKESTERDTHNVVYDYQNHNFTITAEYVTNR